MPTIQVSKHELLRAVAQLGETEYEEFVPGVLALRPEKTLAGLSEDDLLERIHHSLPDEIRRRYRELSTKARQHAATPTEHAELLSLIDRVEMSDAERVRALGELGRRRNQTVEELMRQLGIKAPPYE